MNLRLQEYILFVSHLPMLAVPPMEYTGPDFARKGCRQGVHQNHWLDIPVCTPIDCEAVVRQLNLYMCLIMPVGYIIQELLFWEVFVSCFYIENGIQPKSHEGVCSFV